MSENAALERLARLSASELLTATILHELTQPLSAASNFAAALHNLVHQEDLRANRDDLVACVDRLNKAVKRSASIISSVRALVVDRRPVREHVSVDALFRSALTSIEGTPGLNWVHLQADTAGARGSVICDPVQVEQVLVNLLLNAVAATQNEGSPRIFVTAESRKHGIADVIEVTVADNGPGVEAGDESLYRPFLSARTSGTGLGLPLCRSLIELHGGKLWHEPSALGGAAFCFTLPQVPAAG